MNRILDIGYSFFVPEKNDGCFVIKKILGTGASSVTYLAESNQTEHILKECNPLGLHMHRDDNGVLVPDTELNKTKFEEYLARFIDGVNNQLAFRLTDDLKNTTSNVQAIYHANGTVYIDMTCFNGATYDQVEDESLYDLLRRMKALTQVVGHYHEIGYLHLDIKPQNIYTIPETPEIVMMFDFDSVVPQSDVEKMVLLSYTDSWAAPEQKMAKYRQSICKATDLFAVGEIIFYRIMGRHSTSDERFDFSKYEYDKDAPLFRNINPKVFHLLNELFHKTLCYSPSARYQSAKELGELLDKAIILANPHEPYLVSTLPASKKFFIGRDAEIEDIHAKLQQNRVLFLHGIGGIGKSELAKQYAMRYGNEYDTVIFAPYISDVVTMIADDNYIQIHNFSRMQDEKVEDYYARKLNKIKSLIQGNRDRVLMFVDNFDTAEDSNMNDLLSLGCKVLVTSRVDFSDEYAQVELASISNPIEIFDEYYKKPLSDTDRDIVNKIIGIVCRHTMTVELLAKQMMAGRIKPEQMLKKLESSGISDSGKEKVRSVKDGNLTMQSTFDHIQALFDLSELDENENFVLVNLSLIPHTGISAELFCEWCEIDNFDTINTLAMEGWIRWDKEKDYISLHPVVADVMREELKRDFSICDRLIISINKYIKENYSAILKETNHAFLSIVDYMCNKISSFDVFSIYAIGLIGNVTTKFMHVSNPYVYASYLKKAINIYEKMSCKTDKSLASMYNTLGHLYLTAEFLKEAEEAFNYALNISEPNNETLGLTLSIYNNLAGLYHKMDCFDKAEMLYEKALSTRIKFYGEYHEETAISYNNLGTLLQSNGYPNKAKKYFESALSIWLKTVGKQHPYVATCYSNIGSIYAEQHMFEQAEEYFHHALTLRIEQYGENNADVATSYNSLGMLYKRMNQYDKAESYYKKALNIRQNLFGETHSATASTYMNLSSFYREHGDINKAEEFGKKSLDIFTQIFGEEHHLTATAYSHLATLYLQQGDLSLSEELYKKALDIRIKLYGENHSDTARSQNDMGAVCLKSGKYTVAIDYFSKALETLRSLYGEQHGTVAANYLNIASAYFCMKRYDQAEILYQKSLSINQAIFGENHSETATSYNNLGALYETCGDIEKAEAFHLKAHKIWTELYGENSLKTVTSYQNLGVLYRKQGKYQEAIIHLQKACDISLSEYGKLHDNIASAYSALGYTYMLCNEFNNAEHYYAEALQIRKQLYGEDHEKVKLVKDRIQELYSLMSQSQD